MRVPGSVHDHDFPENLPARGGAMCRKGCGTFALQRYPQMGWEYLEYFDHIERTGDHPADARGVYTFTEPPCVEKVANGARAA